MSEKEKLKFVSAVLSTLNRMINERKTEQLNPKDYQRLLDGMKMCICLMENPIAKR